MDPWGHMTSEVFAQQIAAGWDIRPTVAVTKAHINMPELHQAVQAGRLTPDGDILAANGDVKVTKVAVEPVWWLPGVARRVKIRETDLRRGLFGRTGGTLPGLEPRRD